MVYQQFVTSANKVEIIGRDYSPSSILDPLECISPVTDFSVARFFQGYAEFILRDTAHNLRLFSPCVLQVSREEYVMFQFLCGSGIFYLYNLPAVEYYAARDCTVITCFSENKDFFVYDSVKEYMEMATMLGLVTLKSDTVSRGRYREMRGSFPGPGMTESDLLEHAISSVLRDAVARLKSA